MTQKFGECCDHFFILISRFDSHSTIFPLVFCALWKSLVDKNKNALVRSTAESILKRKRSDDHRPKFELLNRLARARTLVYVCCCCCFIFLASVFFFSRFIFAFVLYSFASHCRWMNDVCTPYMNTGYGRQRWCTRARAYRMHVWVNFFARNRIRSTFAFRSVVCMRRSPLFPIFMSPWIECAVAIAGVRARFDARLVGHM